MPWGCGDAAAVRVCGSGVGVWPRLHGSTSVGYDKILGVERTVWPVCGQDNQAQWRHSAPLTGKNPMVTTPGNHVCCAPPVGALTARRRGRVIRFWVISTAFWVKEGGQTGAMARHNPQNGQKCCNHHSPFKSTVHNGYRFPCSAIVTQTVHRRARRRISTPTGRSALEGKGPQRRPQRRLEEVAKAVGGGYCRLQLPLKLALGFRETAAGHKLGALEGGGGVPPPLPMHPCLQGIGPSSLADPWICARSCPLRTSSSPCHAVKCVSECVSSIVFPRDTEPAKGSSHRPILKDGPLHGLRGGRMGHSCCRPLLGTRHCVPVQHASVTGCL